MPLPSPFPLSSCKSIKLWSYKSTFFLFVQDLSLLHGLGNKLVIIPGTHLQIDKLLKAKGCNKYSTNLHISAFHL